MATSFRGIWRKASVLLVLLTMLVGIAAAQERFGEINGTATDASGAVVPDVNITLTNKGTGRVYTTKTSGAGLYFFRDIEPGRYSL